MNIWRRFWHRIGVFVAYAPLLWHDHDWDHGFMLRLLELKLQRMHRLLSDPTRTMSEQKRADMRRLLMCSEICRRQVECDYGSAEYRRLNEKYNKPAKPVWERWNDQTPQESFEWLQWAKRSTAQEAFEWNLLWTTIQKHGKTWWD